MSDPLESPTYTILSFYRFKDISEPENTSLALTQLWKPFKCVGRVYVAHEGDDDDDDDFRNLVV